MVTILLATYNDELYLKAQLESIATQTYENWRLIVGDDGSVDGTLEIVQDFASRHGGQVSVMSFDTCIGNRTKMYIQMVQEAHGPYFMFCDPDDVWKPDKIYLAMQKMEALEERYGKDMPILVHSDVSVVDDNLEMIAESYFQYANMPKRIFLNQLIIQSSVVDCTIMFNRKLQGYFMHTLPVNKILSHGYWTALVARAFGRIGFVNEPTMYNRRHEDDESTYDLLGNIHRLPKHLRFQKADYHKQMIMTMEQVQGFVSVYEEKLNTMEEGDLLRTYGELYYRGKIRRLSFYRNHSVWKEGNIRKLIQWLWG